MWIMTVDQQDSRRVGDRVGALLDALGAETSPLAAAAPRGVVLPFERTVGDEVQAVLADPALVVALTLHLVRLGGWSIGIGAGSVDEPLPASSREASGRAFIHAREAVEAAKSRSRTVPVAVRGDDPSAAAESEAVLALLGAVVARRTAAGWAVVDRMTSVPGTEPPRQEDAAAALGISQQAVSERLRTALWAEELAARPAAARLLRLAAGPRDDGAAVEGEEPA
ncbi:SatD family protein [Cellulomonas sp. C5510]|uniref:SatD family protein n=1 Tax=Cellulomonas sp. C5510 TaxID=2871170 RepID=UPI001C93B3C3|nr:SatD family protein [Cellulomonas sp. C5510]QZN84249.1 SatD family protein [Cellulomonas sp. C5510]